MFGFGSPKNTQEQERSRYLVALHLKHLLIHNLDALREDAFIAGYIKGKIESLTGYFEFAKGFKEDEINRIIVDALINYVYDGGDDAKENVKVIYDSFRVHARDQRAEFKKGVQKGHLVVVYSLGFRDVKTDPDYEKAVYHSKETKASLSEIFGSSITDKQDKEVEEILSAAADLESLWFWDRLGANLKAEARERREHLNSKKS